MLCSEYTCACTLHIEMQTLSLLQRNTDTRKFLVVIDVIKDYYYLYIYYKITKDMCQLNN